MNDRPLAILQVLPKLDTGGAERVVIEICEAIHRTGHHALIACETGALAQAALRAGAEIVPLPLDTKSPFAIRRNAKRLERLIRARGIALVHAHSRAPAWSALWASRATKTPFVTTYHGAYNENSAIKRRYNSVMAEGDRVIAVSHFIAELIAQRTRIPAERIRVIHGGVDPQRFDPSGIMGDRIARMARDWRVELGDEILLLPGRLTGWKGQRLLLDAMRRMEHQGAIAVFAGGAQGREAYVQELVQHAGRLGIAERLRIVGHVEDMPAAMMLADVVVNASTDPEAFGRTIIEAQAMGRITVAAAHGGARETILPGETGLLFTPRDAQALAASLDTALGMDAPTRIAFGQRARAHIVAHYSVAAMQQAVLDVYAELLVAE
ncbi:MAG: glycosyl transferase [Rhodospirillales bacterium 20-64-7]|nr:MAG: glycosyl transferase [Rhodospirillales bacterium 20-64-7]